MDADSSGMAVESYFKGCPLWTLDWHTTLTLIRLRVGVSKLLYLLGSAAPSAQHQLRLIEALLRLSVRVRFMHLPLHSPLPSLHAPLLYLPLLGCIHLFQHALLFACMPSARLYFAFYWMKHMLLQ